jgi:hypothetical protein
VEAKEGSSSMMLSLLEGPVMRVVRARRCCRGFEENAKPYKGSIHELSHVLK